MPETALYLGSDGGVFVEHPRDVRDPSSPQDITTATAVIRVYDVENRPEVVQFGDSDEATDTFQVFGSTLPKVGDTLSVRDNANEVLTSTVAEVTPDSPASTIRLNDSLAAGRKVPNQMRFWYDTIGLGLPMSLYGTPAPDSDDWGYRGTVAENSPGLYHDQHVIVEVDFDGGTGLRRITYLSRVVQRANT